MMKWILGVNKKATGAAICGDTGRCPLSIVCSKRLIDYFERVTAGGDSSDVLAVVRDAVIEQKTLGLDWFTGTESVIKKCKESVGAGSGAEVMAGELLGGGVGSRMRGRLVELWSIGRGRGRGLGFYGLIGSQYRKEGYLGLTQGRCERARSVARVRMSARPLRIEDGRCRGAPGSLGYCRACCAAGEVTATLLSALPFNEMPVETELHALLECAACSDLGGSTPPSFYEAIKPEVWSLFDSDDLARRLAAFLGRLLSRGRTVGGMPSNS